MRIFLALSLLALSSLHAAEKAPNIIFILADDLGYGDLGCFGQETLKTPNIDRMASEGMKLTRHYAGSTVCAPSRCVLMTGLHTGHCTVRGNNPVNMKPEDITVAEVLQKAGYTTGCFGKWGIGNPPPRDEPNKQGFDQFYGYVNMFHAHNFYPEFLIRNGEVEKLSNVVAEKWKAGDGAMGGKKEGVGVAEVKNDYAPDLIADDAVKFIETGAKSEKPFFLYFAMNVPHANNEGGRPPLSDGMEVPDYGDFAKKDWANPEKGFASMIRNIDRDVGRVLDKVRELGIGENTFVIFSSDNGPHSEGRHEMEFFDSNGMLRGKKRDLYDGGVRVPTLAWWPGKVEAGSVSDVLSGFQDFLPTAAELAGAESPETTDGISLVPTLSGNPNKQAKHEFLYWEFIEQGGKKGVTDGKWKGIFLNVLKKDRSTFELYDLENDPAEESNVASENPEVAKRLKKLIEQSHTES